MKYLAQINIARLFAPIGHPSVRNFVVNLDLYRYYYYLIGLILGLGTCIPQTMNGQDVSDWMHEYQFVYLDTTLDYVVYDFRYAGTNNFVGQPINGYKSDRLVMTILASKALHRVEKNLYKLGYGLKIFDTYRPQRAVDHFKRWASDPNDTLTKALFYPNQVKSQLFQLGYISSRSGHSRGSTIDLTMYHLSDSTEVDMGGTYDYFGERSHHDFTDITRRQKRNRKLLKTTMSIYGFRSYAKEWWHYTLRGEPYPNTYFDHVVGEE